MQVTIEEAWNLARQHASSSGEKPVFDSRSGQEQTVVVDGVDVGLHIDDSKRLVCSVLGEEYLFIVSEEQLDLDDGTFVSSESEFERRLRELVFTESQKKYNY